MSEQPQVVLEALKFEKATRVKKSVLDDQFYQAPPESSQDVPGTLLKVEKDVDTTPYLIPAGTALSKIVYQSEKLNGTPVPVSAYILWPYAARYHPNGYRVVAWAHGISGTKADHAASNHRTFWQHFLAPYQLALQGYVVVATDYAGLGVSKDAFGAPIIHEYLASPSQANDLVHSVSAAKVAFPGLSKEFVVIGHSQGGGAAWAVAQKAATCSIIRYLGAIAISPYTNFLNEESVFGPQLRAIISRNIASNFPDFKPQDILTSTGENLASSMYEADASVAAIIPTFHNADLVEPDWTKYPHVQRYGEVTGNGGKPIRGPLLIIHGEADPMNNPSTVKAAVNKTASRFPSAQLQSIWLPDVRHASALGASQHIWMDWISDRFEGVEVFRGHQASRITSARPSTAYHKNPNWYLEAASQTYQTV